MAGSWLHRCLELFPESVQARHGWRPDYASLEALLEPVRRGERPFSYRDLEAIQNGRFWDFRQFWRFPAESDILRELDFGEMSSLVQRLPLDEAHAIARLHVAFKYIENVSVVLRFVHPDHYGIISPPVEKVLEVRRGRTEVETYLNYLKDLREVRAHHGLARVADADMALWVVQERVLSSYRDHDLLREFRADTWLLRRRAVNLLAELGEVVGSAGQLELARGLLEANVALAGTLAGAELERALFRRIGRRAGAPAAGGLEASLPAGMSEAWRRAARVRDGFFQHEDPARRPSRREVMELIEFVEQLRQEES